VDIISQCSRVLHGPKKNLEPIAIPSYSVKHGGYHFPMFKALHGPKKNPEPIAIPSWLEKV